MTIKIFFGLIGLLSLTCCSTRTTRKQLTLASDFGIKINSPDTIGKDQQLLASIHIDNQKYKLIDASFDCNITDTTTVDILKGKINGCNMRLVLDNDSVKIQLTTGQNTGLNKFHEITLLAKGIDSIFYYQKCTFDYYV